MYRVKNHIPVLGLRYIDSLVFIRDRFHYYGIFDEQSRWSLDVYAFLTNLNKMVSNRLDLTRERESSKQPMFHGQRSISENHIRTNLRIPSVQKHVWDLHYSDQKNESATTVELALKKI